LSVLVVIVLAVLTKKVTVGLLVGYVLVILGETVVFRTHSVRQVFQPQLFWSYEVWDIQKEQILANILAYIPLGLIAGKLWRWKGLIAGVGLSVVSEVLQLITHRGLFEFDDIIHNTFGTLIGVSLIIIIEKVIKKGISNGLQE